MASWNLIWAWKGRGTWMEVRVEVPTEEAQGAVGLGRGAGRDRRE